ncbi:dihydrofolate reductase [Candidatus Daviesbacteria bacterium]|nr:dihydrofolate reductase [Candidatus Daviesbacteria bacterium]
MNKPKISLIAAIASGNRALGKGGKLIYYIPEDLKRFKKITSGYPIIMGRKTFESIGQPLPSRTNIVITRDRQYFAEGIIVVHSVGEALKEAEGSDEVFVIGGGQIYQETISMASKLYLTVVEGNPEADTFFPDFQDFKKVVFDQSHESNGLKYKFLDLER